MAAETVKYAKIPRKALLKELSKSGRAQSALQLLGLPDLSDPDFNEKVDGLVDFIARAKRKLYPKKVG